MNGIDLRVVLLGCEAVGKTCLRKRFISDRYDENVPYQATLGSDFSGRRMCADDVVFNLGVWDTAGAERFEAIARMYYRGAKAAIICYDVMEPRTWKALKYWLRELRDVEEECMVYICATKKDLWDATVTPALDTMKRYAANIGATFFTTSSKTGENVQNLRTSEQFEVIKLTHRKPLPDAPKTKEGGCCWW